MSPARVAELMSMSFRGDRCGLKERHSQGVASRHVAFLSKFSDHLF